MPRNSALKPSNYGQSVPVFSEVADDETWILIDNDGELGRVPTAFLHVMLSMKRDVNYNVRISANYCQAWISGELVCKLFCLDSGANRSRAICPGNRFNIRLFARNDERSWFVAGNTRKWITTAVEKTFKVNIVKIHFLPAIRSYSFPCFPPPPSPPLPPPPPPPNPLLSHCRCRCRFSRSFFPRSRLCTLGIQ